MRFFLNQLPCFDFIFHFWTKRIIFDFLLQFFHTSIRLYARTEKEIYEWIEKLHFLKNVKHNVIHAYIICGYYRRTKQLPTNVTTLLFKFHA